MLDNKEESFGVFTMKSSKNVLIIKKLNTASWLPGEYSGLSELEESAPLCVVLK